MAFQYNDNRNISNHTHIDYPLTCGTDNKGNVTWVDFIDFRNVEGFGVEPNKQSIGGTWLSVLKRLQGCFDEINTRLNSLDTKSAQLEESITEAGSFDVSDIEEGSITADKLNEDVWDEVTSLAKRIAVNEINDAGASKTAMKKLKSDVGFLNAYIGGLDNVFICRVDSDCTINDIYLFPNETIYIHITEAEGFAGGLEIWVEGYYSERKTFDRSQLNSGDWVSVPVSELIGNHPEEHASITLHSVITEDTSDATDYEGDLFVK